MKCSVPRHRLTLLISIASFFMIVGAVMVHAESAKPVPPIIQAGFSAYASEGPEAAINAWLKGGPMEGEKTAVAAADNFRQIERYLGKYKSYELIDVKDIGTSSKMLYFSMNFDRGAAYASFVIYKREKDWIVQNLDFNTKPETIMPWLGCAGGK